MSWLTWRPKNVWRPGPLVTALLVGPHYRLKDYDLWNNIYPATKVERELDEEWKAAIAQDNQRHFVGLVRSWRAGSAWDIWLPPDRPTYGERFRVLEEQGLTLCYCKGSIVDPLCPIHGTISTSRFRRRGPVYGEEKALADQEGFLVHYRWLDQSPSPVIFGVDWGVPGGEWWGLSRDPKDWGGKLPGDR